MKFYGSTQRVRSPTYTVTILLTTRLQNLVDIRPVQTGRAGSPDLPVTTCNPSRQDAPTTDRTEMTILAVQSPFLVSNATDLKWDVTE
jgi:hypothetical protein